MVNSGLLPKLAPHCRVRCRIMDFSIQAANGPQPVALYSEARPVACLRTGTKRLALNSMEELVSSKSLPQVITTENQFALLPRLLAD